MIALLYAGFFVLTCDVIFKRIVMPHFIVEYASSLQHKVTLPELQQAVWQGAAGSGLFTGPDIKIRLLPYDHYQVGTERTDFIHITARILTGRSAEQRQQLAAMVLAQLVALALTAVSLTVEVVEIEKQSYAKQLV
jgi:5-carboxymethyl-2-hydroxymuconate isomerase